MGKLNKRRAEDILVYCKNNGLEKTMEKFKLSRESVRRYRRFANGSGEPIQKPDALVERLLKQYTPAELECIANGHSIREQSAEPSRIKFTGKHLRIGFITDTHIGSRDFHDTHLHSAFDEFKRQDVHFICHTGDVTEGMSHREGHIYDLADIGYQAQLDHAVELFSHAPAKVYAIDGNHDRWYIKRGNVGALIVKAISKQLGDDKFAFIGHDEADIDIQGIKIRLFHGEDASSYATSYRIQKLIEAMRGGDKPNVLLVGHTHKTIFMPGERNVHCFSGGCIQMQTAWMRGKRIAAHCGFWVIDMDIANGGVADIGGRFYPFY